MFDFSRLVGCNRLRVVNWGTLTFQIQRKQIHANFFKFGGAATVERDQYSLVLQPFAGLFHSCNLLSWLFVESPRTFRPLPCGNFKTLLAVRPAKLKLDVGLLGRIRLPA